MLFRVLTDILFINKGNTLSAKLTVYDGFRVSESGHITLLIVEQTFPLI